MNDFFLKTPLENLYFLIPNFLLYAYAIVYKPEIKNRIRNELKVVKYSFTLNCLNVPFVCD